MPLFEIMSGAGALQFFYWVRDKYGSELKDKIEKSLKKFDWNTSSKVYRNEIEQNCNTIRLFGSDAPIKLHDIYTDVYLMRNAEAFEFHRLLDATGQMSNEMRLDGVEFVKKSGNFLYILGRPGAGKSTFLKRIAVEAADNNIKRIPVFVTLKDWANAGGSLLDYLVKQFDVCRYPDAKFLIEYLLETGQMIVLLDGLDEVPEQDKTRGKIIDEIKDFTTKYKNNQFLMTCRIAATDYTFQVFTYLRMADFTPEQIATYVNNWFKGKSAQKRDKFKEALFNPKNERFLKMASQPLLLSLLCINYNETMTFSESRTDIYEEAIGVLMDEWSASKDVQHEENFPVSKGNKMKMFAEIAYKNLSKSRFAKEETHDRFLKRNLTEQIADFLSRLPKSPTKEEINGERILKNIEANNSILVERYYNIYSFGHLSFQEYFAARYISEKEARIKNLLSPQNLIDDKWREVILNTAALLGDADDFFRILQNSINQIIVDNPKILRLLERANKKSLASNSDEKISSVRSFYIYLLILEDVTYSVNLASVTTLMPISELARELNGKLTLFISNTINFAAAGDKNINSVINLNIADALNLNDVIALDYRLLEFIWLLKIFYAFRGNEINLQDTLDKIEYYLGNLIEISQKVNKNITSKLQELVGITKNIDREKYNKAIGVLNDCLRQREMKGDFYMNAPDTQKLKHYFAANKLLLECLDIAIVSDR